MAALAEIDPGDSLADYVSASDAVFVGVLSSSEVVLEPETDLPYLVEHVDVRRVLDGALDSTSVDFRYPIFRDPSGSLVNIRGGRLPRSGEAAVYFVRATGPSGRSITWVNSAGRLGFDSRGRSVPSAPDSSLSRLVADDSESELIARVIASLPAARNLRTVRVADEMRAHAQLRRTGPDELISQIDTPEGRWRLTAYPTEVGFCYSGGLDGTPPRPQCFDAQSPPRPHEVLLARDPTVPVAFGVVGYAVRSVRLLLASGASQTLFVTSKSVVSTTVGFVATELIDSSALMQAVEGDRLAVP